MTSQRNGCPHFFVTCGQFWPPGIVVACIRPSIHLSRLSVCHQVFPRDNSSPVQAKIPIVFWGDWPWPLRSNLTSKSKFTLFWACEFAHAISHHRLKSGFPNLDQKCILVLLRSLLIWGLIFSFIFNFKPVIFYQTLRLLFICIILYIFSEAIASECSTSHNALHIYWFLCTRTWFRHEPWNSLLLYLGATIGI